MKIKSKKIIDNGDVYCLTTNTFHNFVIPTKEGKGIVVSQCNAGAQALNNFDTYLAPFIKLDKMTKSEVSQCIQAYLFNSNQPSRWGCFNYDTVIEVESKEQVKIELESGKIILLDQASIVVTKNRGPIVANDLNESDDLDDTDLEGLLK